MTSFQKSLLPMGAVLSVGLLILAAPRTVHAVAAALVEVTNTASNPVVTSDVGRSASQIVSITCTGGSQPCYAIEPGGGLITPAAYTVPEGQSLVITDIEMLSLLGTGTSSFQLRPVSFGPQGGATDQTFAAANDGTTHLFQLSPGIVWPSGGVISTNQPEDLIVTLRGYLTSN